MRVFGVILALSTWLTSGCGSESRPAQLGDAGGAECTAEQRSMLCPIGTSADLTDCADDTVIAGTTTAVCRGMGSCTAAHWPA